MAADVKMEEDEEDQEEPLVGGDAITGKDPLG